jgi:hypothetical protein
VQGTGRKIKCQAVDAFETGVLCPLFDFSTAELAVKAKIPKVSP